MFPYKKKTAYCDTDSLIVLLMPGQTIETSNIIGGLEEEYANHGGITEYVAVGPKGYGVKCADGYTVVKQKGFTIKKDNSKILNFDKMVEMVTKGIETMEPQSILIPQINFEYKSANQTISTVANLKSATFDPNNVKGVMYQGDEYEYPCGYIRSEEEINN
jgi:hypothetical protein